MRNETILEFPEAVEGLESKGRVFKPSRSIVHKDWTQATLFLIVVYLIAALSWIDISYLVSIDDGFSHAAYMEYWWPIFNFWYVVINACWYIPAMIAIPIYYNSMEYSVFSESGDVMPEIFVKKGIINITRKHVPFRTVTNISSRAGPFDRLFKIGNIEIETAGYSGSTQYGPEEKIVGVKNPEKVRDLILLQLRRFHKPYTTGTEVVTPEEEPVPRMDDSLQDELLLAVREIRDLLKTKL